MSVKFSLKNLNFGPFLLHPTNTYTCEVIITPRVRGGDCLFIDST